MSIVYTISQHGSGLWPAAREEVTRHRADAAHQLLWAVLYEALGAYGLRDTRHAWNIRRDWEKLRLDLSRGLKPGHKWHSQFNITTTHQVVFTGLRT